MVWLYLCGYWCYVLGSYVLGNVIVCWFSRWSGCDYGNEVV